MANIAKFDVSTNEKFLIIKEALADFYVKQHKAALNAKMTVHKKMKTYKRIKLSSLSPDTKILSFRMMFKIKRDLIKKIVKFKIK